jgi:hypothetical protein
LVNPTKYFSGIIFDFVLPHAKNPPAKLLERSVYLPVATLVPENLADPEILIGLGYRAVLRAAVPKASVDENGNAMSSKHYVWRPRQRSSAIYSISISGTMQCRSKRYLWRCSRSPDAGH